jgi:hypothetical protein
VRSIARSSQDGKSSPVNVSQSTISRLSPPIASSVLKMFAVCCVI